MAIIDLTTLKSNFETGDIPTGNDFVNLIDTLHDVVPANIATTDADIIPKQNSVFNIGSSANRFKTIYVDEARLSTNTLYIGDTPILGTNQDTIEIKANADQSVLIKTTGTGETNITSQSGVNITTSGLNSDVMIQSTGTGSLTKVASNTEVKLTAPQTTIDGAGNVTGNLTISGNLIVNGAQTIVDSTTVTTKDNIILVNKGEIGNGVTSIYAGIQVDRGEGADYQIVFDESEDMFKVGMLGDLQTIASHNYVTSAVSGKANTSSVYTKSEVDGAITSAVSTKANSVNASLTNPTITNYTETLYVPSASSAFTVNLDNGTYQKFTTNANTTITLPAAVAGKSYTIIVAYGGTHTLSFTGGSTLKWSGGTVPTPTSVNGKFDIYVFCSDGVNTYGSDGGRNF